MAEAVGAVAAGRDPLAAIRDTPPDSRLSVALQLHTGDLAEADQECLAFLHRLPHVEFSVATRFASHARIDALITAGLVHSGDSPARRLTANEAIAREAERRVGTARIDALIASAGVRMLEADGERWCSPLAVSIAERWHHGDDTTDTLASPAVRARVTVDAAREANDRADAAHAAVHAARGLRSLDSPALRLEAAYALAQLGTGADTITIDAIDPGELDDEGRGRLARVRACVRAVIVDRGLAVPLYAATRGDGDAEIEKHLDESARAGASLEWTRAVETAERARERARSCGSVRKFRCRAGAPELRRSRRAETSLVGSEPHPRHRSHGSGTPHAHLAQSLTCRSQRDRRRITAASELTGQAPERRVVILSPDTARLAPCELECTLGIVIGHLGDGGVRDIARNPPFEQRVGHGTTAFTALLNRGQDELLRKHGVIQVAEVDETVDQIGDHDVVGARHLANSGTRLGDRQRARAQLAQQQGLGAPAHVLLLGPGIGCFTLGSDVIALDRAPTIAVSPAEGRGVPEPGALADG